MRNNSRACVEIVVEVHAPIASKQLNDVYLCVCISSNIIRQMLSVYALAEASDQRDHPVF